MTETGDLSAECRERAREYRTLAREAATDSKRLMGAQTPTGKRVAGHPDELRERFSKKAQKYEELALLASEAEELLGQIPDLKSRIRHLEQKQNNRYRPSRNGGRP